MKLFLFCVWLAAIIMVAIHIKGARAADTWVAASITSAHVGADRHYNANNLGLGLESTDGAISYMAGAYRNSVKRTSVYALAGWAPLQFGPVRFGIAAGAVTGYPKLNNGHIGPAVAGLIRIEHGRFGINLLVIPPVEKKSPLTIGLQIKVTAFGR